MYKILSIGTSFNHGLGLHFYERHIKGLTLNYTLRPGEPEFNVYNAFHSILARKLNTHSEILNYVKFGLDTKFDDMIYNIKIEVEKEQEIPIKIVVIQLSNAEKDFFIYNDNVYRINFNSAEEFIISKNELISSIPDDIKDDFTKKFEEEFDLYLYNTTEWRQKHATWFIDKLNELNKFLLKKGIILQIISYYTDYNQSRNIFDKNLFVKLLANKEYFNDIKTMCDTNKLRICDDIGGIDEHPNFEGHQVVADSLYNSIVKHPLYQSIQYL
jgi:hypothetical protein